jgi:hypothetical protein
MDTCPPLGSSGTSRGSTTGAGVVRTAAAGVTAGKLKFKPLNKDSLAPLVSSLTSGVDIMPDMSSLVAVDFFAD